MSGKGRNFSRRGGGLFTFSGIDGAGKSTQIEMIELTLQQGGVPTKRVWARGGYTPLFAGLKWIMRAMGRGSLPPPGRTAQRETLLQSGWRRKVWLTIAIMDLALYYGLWVRGLRWFGFVVLSDRYLLDTELDFALNFPEDKVSRCGLWRFLGWVVPKPDAAFIFLIDVEESLARSRVKNEPFPDSHEVLAARWKKYDVACKAGAYLRIDGTRPREEISTQLIEAIRAVRVE